MFSILPSFTGVNTLFKLAYFSQGSERQEVLTFITLYESKRFFRISRYFSSEGVASKRFREKKYLVFKTKKNRLRRI